MHPYLTPTVCYPTYLRQMLDNQVRKSNSNSQGGVSYSPTTCPEDCGPRASVHGTIRARADQMEEWLFTGGADGFTIQFPYLPQGLDDFVEKLVPILQKKGIYREDYEGNTLRENLGLPRPENQFLSV